MKVAELEIGMQYEVTLVVTSATPRETKAKKPFLSLELFDGTDTITGNYWDWASGNIPEKNAIVDIIALVQEWQGNKQLNIKSMALNKTNCLADFAPTSEYDISETYRKAYALMSDVKDDELRAIALTALEDFNDKWITVPGAVSVHHNYIGGTLIHSYNVAVLAKAMAETIEGANVDLATVGAMLHDIGKLFTYELDGVSIDMTLDGQLYEHVFIGAECLGEIGNKIGASKAKQRLLRHVVLAHHGKLEFGSPVTPKCIEAYIVNYADLLDATNEQIRVASKKGLVTDRIWSLNNSVHLSHNLIKDLMQ